MLKLLCILRVTSAVKTYQVSLALGNYGQMTQPQYGCNGLSCAWVLKSDLDANLLSLFSRDVIFQQSWNLGTENKYLASDAHPVHNHYFHGLRCLLSKKQKRFAQYFI